MPVTAPPRRNAQGATPLAVEGIATAIVAVTGVVDEVNDIIVPDAFRRTLATRRVKHVWAHDWKDPIGVVLSAEEWMPRDPRLPKLTPDGKPWPREAGALVVVVQFNLATTRGKDAWEQHRQWAERGEAAWSIGYKVVPEKTSRRGGIRYIRDLDLFEASPVLHGAHPLTSTIEWKTGQAASGTETKTLRHSDVDTDADSDLVAAGLVVRAADTGRVLLLQRALDGDLTCASCDKGSMKDGDECDECAGTGRRDPDPAAGTWEFPGGHIEGDEDPLTAAKREWQEETGATLPSSAKVVASWRSANGVYQGFVVEVPSESAIDINADHEDRRVKNPDDPDGDMVEVVAWWTPTDLPDMPALRAEARETPWTLVVPAAPEVQVKAATMLVAAARGDVEAKAAFSMGVVGGSNPRGPFDPTKHPRVPKGMPGGGKFASLGRGDGYQKTGRAKRKGRVQEAQRALISGGFLGKHDGRGGHGDDGLFGPKTERAVKKWQRKNGFKVTGRLTPAQARKLLAGAKKKTGAAQAAVEPPHNQPRVRIARANRPAPYSGVPAGSQPRPRTPPSIPPRQPGRVPPIVRPNPTVQVKAGGADRSRGNAEELRKWFVSGAGAAAIGWGTPGDGERCHAIASKHMTSDEAWGYCQLRHKEATGQYMGQHEGKAAALVAAARGAAAAPTTDLEVKMQMPGSYEERLGKVTDAVRSVLAPPQEGRGERWVSIDATFDTHVIATVHDGDPDTSGTYQVPYTVVDGDVSVGEPEQVELSLVVVNGPDATEEKPVPAEAFLDPVVNAVMGAAGAVTGVGLSRKSLEDALRVPVLTLLDALSVKGVDVPTMVLGDDDEDDDGPVDTDEDGDLMPAEDGPRSGEPESMPAPEDAADDGTVSPDLDEEEDDETVPDGAKSCKDDDAEKKGHVVITREELDALLQN